MDRDERPALDLQPSLQALERPRPAGLEGEQPADELAVHAPHVRNLLKPSLEIDVARRRIVAPQLEMVVHESAISAHGVTARPRIGKSEKVLALPCRHLDAQPVAQAVHRQKEILPKMVGQAADYAKRAHRHRMIGAGSGRARIGDQVGSRIDHIRPVRPELPPQRNITRVEQRVAPLHPAVMVHARILEAAQNETGRQNAVPLSQVRADFLPGQGQDGRLAG